ncbi:MAG: hypothetical protein ISN26_05340 [Betaproteobacteria bacterium AqS2]|uniref:Uncharacterized protein n=1 Tax=Candidatus Amphirhobacter heronislandensis TaxID=1732024 RepID=A0A930UCN9_9GAMM|nr:hypothetical protein [Betaproteobacteria bacterium AqS2]
MSEKKGSDREVLEKYLLGALTLGGSKLQEIWAENAQEGHAAAQSQQDRETVRRRLEQHLRGAATLGGSKLLQIWRENSLRAPKDQGAPDE